MGWFERQLMSRVSEIARATVFPSDITGTRRSFVLVYAIRLCFLVGKRLWSDKCLRQAAALSFQTMLSLIPLLALALVVVSTLGLARYQEYAIVFVERNLVPEAARQVSHVIAEIVANFPRKTMGILGGAVLAVISVMMLFNVESVVNEIFRSAHRRKLWIRSLIALTLLLLAPPAIGISIYFTGELLALPGFAAAPVPLLLTVLALFLCYWLLPHTRPSKRYSLISAFAAGILFEVLKLGFGYYARYFGFTISNVYGAFSILPLFMVWIYLAWLIFLFGAEINASLHEVRHHGRRIL